MLLDSQIIILGRLFRIIFVANLNMSVRDRYASICIPQEFNFIPKKEVERNAAKKK